MDAEKICFEKPLSQRSGPESLEKQQKALRTQPGIQFLIDAIPTMTAVLNNNLEIILANQSFADFAQKIELGARPGEAVRCINARSFSSCGISRLCQICGAIKSILESRQSAELASCEWHLTREKDNSDEGLDLRVWARTVEFENEQFTVFSFMDISSEKRRNALERIFFHDVLNTIDGIQGVSDLLQDDHIPDAEVHELAHLLNLSTVELVDEIREQKTLTYAETGELKPEWKTVESSELMDHLQHQYQNHPASENRSITLNSNSEHFKVVTDHTLIHRALGNLIKNALEASVPGATISLQCHHHGHNAIFTVHNPGIIPLEVQRQIFKRSVSTKGEGRGLGTYSIKLLVEHYLKGHVSFISTEQTGTLFRVEIPLEPNETTTTAL